MTGDVPVFNIDVTVRSTALEKQLPDSLLFDEQARIYTAALQEHLIRGEIEAAVLDAQPVFVFTGIFSAWRSPGPSLRKYG